MGEWWAVGTGTLDKAGELAKTTPHLQALQVLDQAALQVAGAAGLDGGVHQALPPRHAVEVVLLGAQACIEERYLYGRKKGRGKRACQWCGEEAVRVVLLGAQACLEEVGRGSREGNIGGEPQS